MTVSTTQIKNSYSGDGSNKSFAYTFKIFEATECTVIVRTNATGTESVRSIGSGSTNYAITGAGNETGGTVTFVTAPLATETVVLRRTSPLTQTTDYVENSAFAAESHEDALDKLTHLVQEVQEEVDRSFKVSRTNTITTTEFTEGSTDRANKLLSFDASGDLSVSQELGIFRGNWAASTAYDVRDLVKDTSTNNVFIATTAHTSSGAQPLTTNTDSAKWSLIVDAASATSAQTAAASSATAAASSASAAATSESNASSSASSASTSAGTATTKASEASTSAASAAASFDDFDDKYLGAKSSEPSADNDGDALATGALFFDTTAGAMKVFNGSAWEAAFVGGSGFLAATNNLSDVSAAATARTNLGLGSIATQAANSVAITGGSVTGITDLAVPDGGTGASSFTANGVIVGNGSSALQVTATGSSGQILTSNGSGSAPTFQNAAAASGVVTATASGSITAGKTVILNSNGTVSEISATSVSHAVSASSYTQSGETTAESNSITYDTTDEHFIFAGRNTISGSNVGRTYALDMNSSLVISEAAPPITLDGNHLGVWSVRYCPAMQRTIVHAQNSGAGVSVNTVNVVSGVMKASNKVTWTTSNKPYGTTICFDANELVGAYGTTTSPTSNRIAFVDASLGSDASGDTFSNFTSEIDVGEGDMTSQSHTYYHQAVHFSVADKWLFGSFKYSSSGYGLGYAVGTVGGSSGGSRTFTAQSSGTIPSNSTYGTDPESFMPAGQIEYDSTKDRAFVFDSEFLYSLSVGTDGVLKQSSLQRIQAAHEDSYVRNVISIPNSDHVVVVFGDQDNSNRTSYRVVRFTKGSDATADTFTLEGSNQELTTNTASSGYTRAVYSPDVDAFLIKEYMSGVAQPYIGFRVARTTTNVKASGTVGRFLGVAKSTVSNGQSVEIAVAGSVATMAAGGMTIGDTQFVQYDGSVSTTDAGYGTAGIAVSATQVLME